MSKVQKEMQPLTTEIVVQCCHYCSDEKKLGDIDNPISMKLKSGITVNFCNDTEKELWMSKHNISYAF